MTPIVQISRLTKRYGSVEALKDVSLTVDPGKRVAVLGHNGAGKSTMMKIVLGLISFNSGKVDVCDAEPGSSRARSQVAYLPENVSFHPSLTGEEQIRYYLSLRGENPDLSIELLDRVGLSHAARRRIGGYSKGMRQRVGLAQALIGHPRLLILDEPTSGLDPISRREFYDLLDQLAADGASILLSSHALTEVEARTDHIIILSGGRLVTEGTLADLRRRADLPFIIVVTPADGAESELASAFPRVERTKDGRLKLLCEQSQKLPVLSRIAEFGGKVVDLDMMPPSLEDIYSHFSRLDQR